MDSEANAREAIETYLGIGGAKHRRNRADSIKLLREFIGGEGLLSLREVTPQKAQAFISWYSSREGQKPKNKSFNTKVAPSTIANRFSHLKKAFDYLREWQVVDYNPFARVLDKPKHSIRRQKCPTRIPPFKLVTRLVRAPGLGTAYALRDRCVIACLFGSSLRPTSLLSISIDDVKFLGPAAYLYIRHTKTRDEVEQPIADFCKPYLVALLKKRAQEGAGPTDPLFTQYRRIEGRGEQLTYFAFRKQYARYVQRTGLDKYDINIRSARASVASKLLDDGVDPWSVAKILGQKTLLMVMHYDKRKANILKSPIRKLIYE